MGWRLLAAGLVVVIAPLIWGCAQKAERMTPGMGLAEINDQIVRGAEESPLLMPGEPIGEETAVERKPRIRDLVIKEDGRNPWLMKGKPPGPVEEREGEEGVLLNFEEADIREVIRVVAETLELNYIIDPGVAGVVNIRTARPIPEDGLLLLLKKILNINGVDIIPEGDHYYIYPTTSPAVQQVYSPDRIGELESSPKVIMQVVPLLYLSSTEALTLIAPYLSEQGFTFNLPDRKMFIVSDYESIIVDIVQILLHLDVSPLADLTMRLVRIENAPLLDLQEEIVELLTAMRLHNREQSVGSINIVPLERLNSLLLLSRSAFLLDNVGKWIEELDLVPANGRDSIFLYNVRNSVASELAGLVNLILAEPEPGTPRPRPVVADPDRERAGVIPRPTVVTERSPIGNLQLANGPILIADDTRNLILIKGLPADYQRLIKLLERLDTLPRQVLIEVMVAEVSLTDRLEFGVEWAIRNRDLTIGGTDYEQRLRSTSFASLSDPGALAGLTYSIFRSADDIRALLNALASDTNVSILSSPRILVLNNEEASINVGDQVPIVTSEVVPTGTEGSTLTRTIQYRDTGVILNVRPRINANGIIILDINQQVSNAIPGISAQLGLNSPVITTRQIRTRLAVQDGQSVMMGGMIRQENNVTQTGVPLLKDIPLLGWLFRSHTENNGRTELLVLITPYVIATEDVLQQYLRSFGEKMAELREGLER